MICHRPRSRSNFRNNVALFIPHQTLREGEGSPRCRCTIDRETRGLPHRKFTLGNGVLSRPNLCNGKGSSPELNRSWINNPTIHGSDWICEKTTGWKRPVGYNTMVTCNSLNFCIF